jgi:sugar/nucleoside kinase (ribokinase family)
MSTDGYAKCIVIGSPLMDLRTRAMTWVDGGQTTVGKFSASAGGSAANVAVTLAQLDVHALIVGRLGDDGMGQVIH